MKEKNLFVIVAFLAGAYLVYNSYVLKQSSPDWVGTILGGSLAFIGLSIAKS